MKIKVVWKEWERERKTIGIDRLTSRHTEIHDQEKESRKKERMKERMS